MRHYPETLRFLVAYLIYNDAVQAVIALAAQFGSDELKISMADLTRRDSHGAVRRVLRSRSCSIGLPDGSGPSPR